MYIYMRTAQTGTGSLVFTLRKNGADTALTITVPAGGSLGVYSNTSNTVTYSAGDLISVSIVNNGSASSGAISSISFKIQ